MRKEVLGLVAVLVVFSGGFLAFKAGQDHTESFDIEYRVVCNECEVSFRNAEGKTESLETVQKEWKYQFQGSKGQFIYVSALNKRGEKVQVKIYRNGQELISDESAEYNVSARTGSIL